MAKLKERFLHFRYKGIICIVLVFSLIAAILFVERSGIQVNYQKVSLDAIPEDTVITKATAFKKSPKNTLLLFNSAKENSMQTYEQFQAIFEDMKVERGEEVAVLINGLGATSIEELSAFLSFMIFLIKSSVVFSNE